MRKLKPIKGLILNKDEMLDIINGKCKVSNIPKDSNILGVNWDHSRNAWFIVVEHISFELHKSGEVMPIISAEFKKQHNK